ncbi:MAG: DUF378 domain-containing protein [Burkholderiaceae bacterium]
MANMENRTADVRTDTVSVTHARRMSAVDWIAMILLIIGGINWGLIGLFDFDLVAYLFGAMTGISRIIYTVVGLCALYALYLCAKMSSDRT